MKNTENMKRKLKTTPHPMSRCAQLACCVFHMGEGRLSLTPHSPDPSLSGSAAVSSHGGVASESVKMDPPPAPPNPGQSVVNVHAQNLSQLLLRASER